MENDINYELRDVFKLLASAEPNWFRLIMRMIETGHSSGWIGVSYYRSLLRAGMEMAWHGASHLSLGPDTSRDSVGLELELATRLFSALEQRPKTIIFPRGVIGHLEELRSFGFENYRATNAISSRVGRLSNLAKELNLWATCDPSPPAKQNGWRVSRKRSADTLLAARGAGLVMAGHG